MDKYARFRYQPCLPLGKDGRRVTASKEHIALSRAAAAEGCVLLRNEGVLPLSDGSRIALFGKATVDYIKGGGGSGDVNCPYIRNIADGFLEKESEGRCEVYKPLIGFYREYAEAEQKNVLTDEQISARWDIVNNMEFCCLRDDMTYDTFQAMHIRETEVPDELIASAAEFADTAVYTISRFSAEGTDRRTTPGDYTLSETERELLGRIREKFARTVVVLNTGAVLDCEDFANAENTAVLLAWQGGMEGGGAVADVIFGDVNPSGKLPDTIVKSYDCYPSKDDYAESYDYLNYSEDIYVGYRYFATIPGQEDNIRYPFGYGLSYSSFSLSEESFENCGDELVFGIKVTNTGEAAGKEAAAVYCSAPQGLLGKPSRVLAAFEKTKLLAPGESQTLVLRIPKDRLASFDDTGRIRQSAFVLEKGAYRFFLGADVTKAVPMKAEFTLGEDRIVSQCGRYCAPRKLPERMLADGTFEKVRNVEDDYFYGDPVVEKYRHNDGKADFGSVPDGISLSDFADFFTIDEMKDFVGGQPPTGVANTGCFGGLRRLNVPAVATADGPAGLRLNKETGIPTTAFPCSTLLAATWNKELVFEVGSAAAAEIRENNIGVWLAPAVNIHRNPMCGRNFEYFSEDPLLAGLMCGAEVRGIQSQKVAVSLKHFAANNKEPNRFAVDSRISERALREIYLRAFEIVVRTAKPMTVMSSYNKINGIHTSESWELLTGILRNEWGFDGMVVTDWGQKNDPVLEVKAGNDMKMHCGYPDDLQKGLDIGAITPEHLKICVMRILGTFTRLAE